LAVYLQKKGFRVTVFSLRQTTTLLFKFFIMKKTSFAFALTIACVMTATTGFAQSDETAITLRPTPRWVPKKGYWVAESNIHTPKHHTIYFYNNDNVLVYKETLDGIVLKLDKRRTKMRLKKMVDQTVAAYAKRQKAAADQMLVAKLIQ
jgi:hypothetical protein